jgi:glycosyltransferase involved in cell wall biosynthesis
MKILHVNDHYDERGGVQQYLLAVTELLAKNGHANAIVYRHHTPHTIHGGPWPAYQVDSDEPEAVAPTLRHIISREHPDVAYIHHVASPALVGAVAGMLPAGAYVHGFPAVCPGLAKYYRRGDQVCQRPFGWMCAPMNYLRRCSDARKPTTLARLMRNTACLRRAYLQVPRILVATPYMKSLLVQNGFLSDRIGILPSHFLSAGEISAYAPPEKPNTLLYVGRLEVEKGVPYLLRALAQLPEDVRLMIAGDGTLRDPYESLAKDLGLGDRVKFLGWVDADQIADCYRQCALTILPTICPEAFGKSGIESLTHGRPVVAFAVGGIPDWLDDGVTGLLARPANAADLAQKIGELISDLTRQAEMGRQGQRVVAERYTSDRHLDVLQAALQEARNG